MNRFSAIRIFSETGDFAAINAAKAALTAAGFSLGPGQRGAPIGILHGNVGISKWRNMTAAQRDQLHGTIEGDFRSGPVTVRLRDNAPAEAVADFMYRPGIRASSAPPLPASDFLRGVTTGVVITAVTVILPFLMFG